MPRLKKPFKLKNYDKVEEAKGTTEEAVTVDMYKEEPPAELSIRNVQTATDPKNLVLVSITQTRHARGKSWKK